MGNLSQSYGASLAIWDHTVLPATRHKWTRPAITPAKQAGTRFTYPGRMEGWVDLASLIAAWPGIEPTNAWLQVRCPNRYATESPVKAVEDGIQEVKINFSVSEHVWSDYVFVQAGACEVWGVGTADASRSLRSASNYQHLVDIFY